MVCGCKQSVRKYYATSYKAKDIRSVVMDLNMKRMSGDQGYPVDEVGSREDYEGTHASGASFNSYGHHQGDGSFDEYGSESTFQGYSNAVNDEYPVYGDDSAYQQDESGELLHGTSASSSAGSKWSRFLPSNDEDLYDEDAGDKGDNGEEEFVFDVPEEYRKKKRGRRGGSSGVSGRRGASRGRGHATSRGSSARGRGGRSGHNQDLKSPPYNSKASPQTSSSNSSLPLQHSALTKRKSPAPPSSSTSSSLALPRNSPFTLRTKEPKTSEENDARSSQRAARDSVVSHTHKAPHPTQIQTTTAPAVRPSSKWAKFVHHPEEEEEECISGDDLLFP